MKNEAAYITMKEALIRHGFEFDLNQPIETQKTFDRRIGQKFTLTVSWETNYVGLAPHWQATLWHNETDEICLSMDFRMEDFKNSIIQQLLINP